MPDLGPNKKKIAQLFRMLGTSNVHERKTAWGTLVCEMQKAGVNWSDIGNVIENGGECDEGKYTESELQEVHQAARAEGVEEGIKMGMARASNGSGNSNGHIVLPKSFEMAEYCYDRLSQLKDNNQRDFVSDMRSKTQRGMRLSAPRLSYLVSIYIKISGTTG
jgi:hypothetical protein